MLDEAVVFAEDFAELVVRDGVGAPVVGAGHGVCSDKGVVHGFFSGLDGGQEEEIDSVADKALNGGDRRATSGRAVALIGTGVGGREGNEDVAGSVGFDCACAAKAEADAFGDAPELIGSERSISGYNNDDGALFGFLETRSNCAFLVSANGRGLTVAHVDSWIDSLRDARFVTLDFASNGKPAMRTS